MNESDFITLDKEWHEIKIESSQFEDFRLQLRTAVLVEDIADYQPQDQINLTEYEYKTNTSGESLVATITHVDVNQPVPDGYCLICFKYWGEPPRPPRKTGSVAKSDRINELTRENLTFRG